MAIPTKDAVVRICYNDLYVELIAEGCAGNPDVMDDLNRRALDTFKSSITHIVESGVMEVINDLGEDE